MTQLTDTATRAPEFTPVERRAMRAIRSLVAQAGGPDAFAALHDLSPRTVLRMAKGQRPPPVGLAHELLAVASGKHAAALVAFIADREAAQHG